MGQNGPSFMNLLFENRKWKFLFDCSDLCKKKLGKEWGRKWSWSPFYPRLSGFLMNFFGEKKYYWWCAIFAPCLQSTAFQFSPDTRFARSPLNTARFNLISPSERRLSTPLNCSRTGLSKLTVARVRQFPAEPHTQRRLLQNELKRPSDLDPR